MEQEQKTQIDFNWVVEEYMRTSNKLELIILKDGLSFSEWNDNKLYIHI